MENQPAKKTSRFGVAMRVLAGVLAILMLLSTVALSLTRIVQPTSDTLTEKAVNEAFASLSANDRYLNASAPQRVRMLIESIGKTNRSAEDYEQLAAIYVGRDEYSEAAELYQSSLDATDKSDAAALASRYVKLASANMLCGRLERAVEEYQKALVYDPTSLLARLLLAQVYIELAEYQKAADHLMYYLTLVPGDAENRRLLGNLFEMQGNYDLADRHYRQVYQATNAPEDCLNCARAAALLGDDEAVIQLFSEYFKSGEDPDGSCHYLRGVSHLRLEDFASAKADLSEAVEKGFSDAGSCYTLLNLCTYMLGDYEGALENGKKAEALWDKPDAECLQRTGLSALQLERYEEAAAELTKSLQADPALVQNHSFIATAYLLGEDYERARDSFGLAIESGYDVQRSYYNRGVCCLQLDDYESAAKDFLLCIEAGEDEELIAAALDFLIQMGVVEVRQK